MACTKYHDPKKDDSEDVGRCARIGCEETPYHKLWITIHGREYDKMFCRPHHSQEHHDESLFHLGL